MLERLIRKYKKGIELKRCKKRIELMIFKRGGAIARWKRKEAAKAFTAFEKDARIGHDKLYDKNFTPGIVTAEGFGRFLDIMNKSKFKRMYKADQTIKLIQLIVKKHAYDIANLGDMPIAQKLEGMFNWESGYYASLDQAVKLLVSLTFYFFLERLPLYKIKL